MLSHVRRTVVLTTTLAAFLSAHATSAQTGALLRVTDTPQVATSLNPTISGDGRRVVFETNAFTDAYGRRIFQAVGADIFVFPDGSTLPHQLTSVARSRAPAPAVSQDGSRIAFASKDDPLGSNRDGNPEIFYFDGTRLQQLTLTLPDDPGRRATDGNFHPSISDDGSAVAFVSNRDLVGLNPERNPEVFLYDVASRQFTQITDAPSSAQALSVKLSGDGSRLAFVISVPASEEGEATRDLVLYDLEGGESRTVVRGVPSLAFTYGRALSDDGSRVVYSANAAPNSSQVFLYDDRQQFVRQLTSLGTRALDVPLHPTISGDGKRIAYATRRNVSGGNPDASVELYLYDLPTDELARMTTAPSGATAEVVSSLSDDGSRLAFNFPRLLSDPSAPAELANNFEIYLASPHPRPNFSTGLKVLNGAAFDRQPARSNSVAPDSIVVAHGKNLSLSTTEPLRRPGQPFPSGVQGTSVSVNGRPAPIFFVSPTQVNFLIPPETEPGTAEVAVTNHEGHEMRGSVNVLNTAPGIFTQGPNGSGRAVALDNATLRREPFNATDAAGNPTRLIIFATGVRNSRDLRVTVGGRDAKVEAVVPSPDLPGLDQIHVVLSSRLKGVGNAPLQLSSEGSQSNSSSLFISDGGGPPRAAQVILTPDAASIPVAGTFQFKASALDALGEEISGAAISFTSGDAGVATVDESGVASGIAPGVASIFATSGLATSASQLSVVERTLVINEVLADPPDGPAGDANRDGTRSGSEDEFVELVNATDSVLGLSNWTVRTRPLTGTAETVRHRFPEGAYVPPGDALVLFGGGNFDPANPAFGGSQVTRVSTTGLSLTNSGLQILVRDGAGNLVTQFLYGTPADDFGGDSVNQSLTRAPDVNGPFVRHTAVAVSRFSPGTKAAGDFFAPRPGRLTTVTLRAAASSLFAGESVRLMARALDQYGRPLHGVTFGFESSDESVASTIAGNFDELEGEASVLLRGLAPGTVSVVAYATQGELRLTSEAVHFTIIELPPRAVRVEITPQVSFLNRGATRQLFARAYDEQGALLTGTSFSWSVSNPSVAGIGADGSLKATGVGEVTITATASNGRGGTVSAETSVRVCLPVVVNELLADVPPDDPATPSVEGDANRDGARNSDDDEFVEILNVSDEPADLSGLVISDATSNRFTFPHGTALPAGSSAVVFGGGAPSQGDPGFGGSAIFKTSSLSLNDSGDAITLKLPVAGSDVIIAGLSYGNDGAFAAPPDQSLTRSPDAGAGNDGGEFAPHRLSVDASGRAYSPGTRTDGAPFGSPPLSRIEIEPVAIRMDVGASLLISARAYARVEEIEIEVTNVSFLWDVGHGRVASVAPSTGTTTILKAALHGESYVRARAGRAEGSMTLNVNPPPPVLTRVVVTPRSAMIRAGESQKFEALALDQYERAMPGTSVTLSSSSEEVAYVEASSSEPSAGLATATFRGRSPGSAQIRATATNGADLILSAPSDITVTAAPPPAGSRVLISQVYGGGGNAGAPFRQDFVELFNAGTNAADLSGWSVQYASAAGTSWQTVNLPPVSLAPGQYLLVEGSGGTGCSGAPCGATLPAPDASSNLALSTSAGKVALAFTTAPFSGQCPVGTPFIMDFVGYGNTSCYEGGGPAPAHSNTTSTRRKDDGCSDSNDNAADFSTAPPSPRNAQTAVNLCSAKPTPTPSPSPTPTPSPAPTPTPAPTPGSGFRVVISQVHGGGGNSGSTYKNDFVELFNGGTETVSLSGWSVQYAGATSSSWQATLLNGSIAPGGYYLLQQAGAGGGTLNLPAPDAAGNVAMAASAGKVILFEGTTTLSGACPASAGIQDMVGYGSTANCFEGTGPAPAPGNSTSIMRKTAGCTDDGNNSSDFSTAPASPRNSSSPPNPCTAASSQALALPEAFGWLAGQFEVERAGGTVASKVHLCDCGVFNYLPATGKTSVFSWREFRGAKERPPPVFFDERWARAFEVGPT